MIPTCVFLHLERNYTASCIDKVEESFREKLIYKNVQITAATKVLRLNSFGRIMISII